jgi:hypothetical protein
MISSVIECEGKYVPGMNIDQSRGRDGVSVSVTTNDGPTQAEAQICTYFLAIVEISTT